jgi:hypothetical protein
VWVSKRLFYKQILLLKLSEKVFKKVLLSKKIAGEGPLVLTIIFSIKEAFKKGNVVKVFFMK